MTSDFWTAESLRQACGGAWALPGATAARGNGRAPMDLDTDAGTQAGAGGARVAGLWHDTRGLQPGEAYLAISGERFDGHTFVGRAFADGAALAIVERGRGDVWRSSCAESGLSDADLAGRVIEVDDAVAALQQLARVWRDWLWRAGVNVAAVLGSNGKTTTRSLLHHLAVGGGVAGVQSPKSFNNHLGAPLTLLRARPEHGFVACEIGTNHPGEVADLAALVRPDLVVMTSIGEEHLEAFVDLAGVAREEWSILEHVSEGGRVLASRQAYEHLPFDVSLEARAAVLMVESGDGVLDAHGVAPLGPAAHQRSNAALAAEAAQRLGAEPLAMVDAARSFSGPEGRMQRIEYAGGVVVIHDAYNANPSSMRAALDAFLAEGSGPGGRVAVLGDMLELGAGEAQAHAEAITQALTVAGRVVLIGLRMARAWGALAPELREGSPAEVVVLGDAEDAGWPTQAAAGVRPGDAVLLKASRGMRLERVLPAIEARCGSLDAGSQGAR